MTNDNKTNNNSTSYTLLIVFFVVVILLYLGSWYFIDDLYNCPEQRGQFGDKFGAVNALFSGFAFAGLIYTIYLQKKELSLQREELTETRAELRGQKEQMEEQNKTLRIQRFENTFFHMMELHQQIVNDLYSKEEHEKTILERTSSEVINRGVIVEDEYRGRNLFMHALIQSIHTVDLGDCHDIKVYGLGGVMELKGLSYYDKYYTSTYFDHYFRHFYRILKFIKQNDSWLSFDEQYHYSSLLRATLSRYELVWLYYNCLSDNGRYKLKPLLEVYSMLKNLRYDLLILCKENKDKLEKVRIGFETLRANSFPRTDYLFFLTDTQSPYKYNLCAFYNKAEMEIGKAYYDRWIKFCSDNNINL